MRLYLDINVYNRPFDNQRISRNRVEAQVVLELLERVENEEISLVSSPLCWTSSMPALHSPSAGRGSGR
ncbi:MAG: hypothetical protein H0V53_09895 [Rubrobacter sp.]|nr:hypothetical protein [Rubrobacter sp.]